MLDPDFPADRLAEVVADAARRSWLTREGLADRLGLDERHVHHVRVDAAADAAAIAAASDQNPDIPGLGQDRRWSSSPPAPPDGPRARSSRTRPSSNTLVGQEVLPRRARRRLAPGRADVLGRLHARSLGPLSRAPRRCSNRVSALIRRHRPAARRALGDGHVRAASLFNVLVDDYPGALSGVGR